MSGPYLVPHLFSVSFYVIELFNHFLPVCLEVLYRHPSFPELELEHLDTVMVSRIHFPLLLTNEAQLSLLQAQILLMVLHIFTLDTKLAVRARLKLVLASQKVLQGSFEQHDLAALRVEASELQKLELIVHEAMTRSELHRVRALLGAAVLSRSIEHPVDAICTVERLALRTLLGVADHIQANDAEEMVRPFFLSC